MFIFTQVCRSAVISYSWNETILTIIAVFAPNFCLKYCSFLHGFPFALCLRTKGQKITPNHIYVTWMIVFIWSQIFKQTRFYCLTLLFNLHYFDFDVLQFNGMHFLSFHRIDFLNVFEDFSNKNSCIQNLQTHCQWTDLCQRQSCWSGSRSLPGCCHHE